MADYYYCLRDSAHSSTVGQDTSDEAVVFLMQQLNPNQEWDITALPLPFTNQYLMNMESSAESVSVTGDIPVGTGRMFTTLEKAEAKLMAITGAVKLDPGTVTGTTWTYNGGLGLPEYPRGSLDMYVSQITPNLSASTPFNLRFTARLLAGTAVT